MARPTRLDHILGAAADAIEAASARFPNERTGPRTPIPGIVRFLVLKRDKFRCDWCGIDHPGQAFHLDHIVPWSAGGTDDTTNLRLLCPTCNEYRSNYRTDAPYVRRIACTPICMPCARHEVTLADFDSDETERVFCGTCSRVSWITTSPAWHCEKL